MGAARSTLLAALLLTQQLRGCAGSNSERIRLGTVKTLTFTAAGMTTGRRAPPVPQLVCIGGDGADAGFRADAVQCTNMGGAYGRADDIQWACSASLPAEVRLGTTDVVCEGYSNPDDPYILRGSCGLEYTLHLTDRYLGGRYRTPSPLLRSIRDNALQLAVLAALLLIWYFWTPLRNMPAAGWAGGGGGGGGGWRPRFDGPPPPYDPYDKPSARWSPGVWSGLAAGAAAGYALGANRRGESSAMGSMHRRSPSPSPPGGSSARHTSTGFGGTRRR